MSSLPLDGRAVINMTMQHEGAAFSTIDYYHRDCGTNLLWSIIAVVDGSKHTDLCLALSEEASWPSTVRVCAHVCVCIIVCWKALQVKCCVNSVQVGFMSSPRVLFCWQADR